MKLKIIIGILAIMLLGGCGSPVRVEYADPKYGGGTVTFTLPKKEGYTK